MVEFYPLLDCYATRNLDVETCAPEELRPAFTCSSMPLSFLLSLPEIIVIRRFGYTQHQAEQINRKQSAGRLRLRFTEAIYSFRLAAITRAFFRISSSKA